VSPTRTLWVLVASTALCFLSIGCYAATLPRFLIDEAGMSTAEVGLAMGLTAGFAIVLRPLAGTFGDRRGRRVSAVAGGVVLALGPVLLLGPTGLLLVLGARALMGAGDALLSTATMAWVVDAAPPERRGRAMATYGMAIWLGFAVGPQWGVAVRDAWGYDAVWIAAAVVALLSGLVCRLLPAPPVVAAPDGRRPRITVPRGAIVPGVAMVCACYGNGIFEAFGIVHLVDQGLEDDAGLGGAASVFTVVAVTTFLGRFAGGALCDRIGPRPVAIAATCVVSAAYALMAFAGSFATAAAAAALLGVGLALIYPSLGLIATRRVAPSQRGAGVGVFTAFMDMAFGAGAVLGGLVVSGTSTEFALASGTVVALLAVPVVLSLPAVADDAVDDPPAPGALAAEPAG
jgi:MFS family permease